MKYLGMVLALFIGLGICSAQVQDNPVTESGNIVALRDLYNVFTSSNQFANIAVSNLVGGGQAYTLEGFGRIDLYDSAGGSPFALTTDASGNSVMDIDQDSLGVQFTMEYQNLGILSIDGGTSPSLWNYQGQWECMGEATQGLEIVNWTAMTNFMSQPLTGDLNLGTNDILGVGSIEFTLDHVCGTNEGALCWNYVDHTLNIQTDYPDVTLQAGQEGHIRVWNDTGSIITNGSLIYISGATNGRPTVALAKADDYDKEDVIAWATHNLPIGTGGIATIWGYVRDLDTSGMEAGDVVWLSDTLGGFGNTPGTKPIHLGHVLTVGTTNGLILAHTPIESQFTALQWSSDNIANRINFFFGTVYQWLDTSPSDSWTDVPGDVGTETLTGPTTNTYALGFYNRHVVLNVTTLTSTGTVVFTGSKVNESTGAIITNFSENVSVTATGHYQTVTKWIDEDPATAVGDLDVATTDANIQYEMMSTSYLDYQNRDFQASNVRFATTPGGNNYDIRLNIWKVNEDGSYTDLDTNDLLKFEGPNDGAAANGIVGHKKAALSTELIRGNEHQGLVVFVSGVTVGTLPAQVDSVDVIIGTFVQ